MKYVLSGAEEVNCTTESLQTLGMKYWRSQWT